jgi:hypothetical protein
VKPLSRETDGAIDETLDTLAGGAARAVFFVLRRGVAEAWRARAGGAPADVAGMRVPLGWPTPFARVVAGPAYVGPLSRPFPSELAIVCRVVVRGVAVGIVVVDGASQDVDVSRAESAARGLGGELERILIEAKGRRRESPVPVVVPAEPEVLRTTPAPPPPPVPWKLRPSFLGWAAAGSALAVVGVLVGAPASGGGDPIPRARPIAESIVAPAPPAFSAPPSAPKATDPADLRIEANRVNAWVEIDGGARRALPLTLTGLAAGKVVLLRAGAEGCRPRTTTIVAGRRERVRIWLPRTPSSSELMPNPFRH